MIFLIKKTLVKNQVSCYIKSYFLFCLKLLLNGSIIGKDGKIDKDVEHRTRAQRLKLRVASRVLFYQHIPAKLKEDFSKQQLDGI